MIYTGELALFEHAVNWKAYWSATVRPHLGKRVLEVGAGTGTNTALLATGAFADWHCLEPDPTLVEAIRRRSLPAHCRVSLGTMASLEPGEQFDAILYIDVLEHIGDDGAELAAAARHLLPGGRLVVLSPAHQFLFSPFDAGVGHHRRYSLTALKACAPAGLELVECRYLDSVGLLASAANRLLLKAKNPTVGQIKLWDRVMVPLSRLIDPVMLGLVGKSVLAVWRKPG